uniref:Signal peptidase I n=1 Tax=Salix viminalis TaxID=40686 RepID=A0A6N2KD61_SALVM
MGWIAEHVESIKSMKIRDTLSQLITLGMIVSTALIIWKGLDGDILFLHMSEAPFRAGEIVVYNVEGKPIPIVHRVIEVHEQENSGKVDILTKGDANPVDDRSLYAYGQNWLKPQQIMGRAVGFVPYAGWLGYNHND